MYVKLQLTITSIRPKYVSGDGRGRKPVRSLQKSFSTESSLNHMVPNSPIHPDAAMRDDGSRETSPVKGNKTPGRKLSPPKHLEAPIVEVTENDSSEENREPISNPDQAGKMIKVKLSKETQFSCTLITKIYLTITF